MDDAPSEKKKAPRRARVGRPKKEATPSVLPVQATVLSKPKRLYHEAVGRRKTAVARVRISTGGKGNVTVGTKSLIEAFPDAVLRGIIMAPLVSVGQAELLDVSIHISGGGMRGQADAIRLGVARCLLKLNPTFRTALKKEGYLRRDARIKERKKYGLKRARRAPQWQKR